MKMNRNAVVIAACLMIVNTGAYAQFGDLGKSLSGLGGSVGNALKKARCTVRETRLPICALA